MVLTRFQQIDIAIDGFNRLLRSGAHLSDENVKRLDAMVVELLPTDLTPRKNRELYVRAKALQERVHADRLVEPDPTGPEATVLLQPHVEPSETPPTPNLFPVLSAVEAGTKRAQLLPKFKPRKGSAAATIERLVALRSIILSATPFTIAGDVAPRTPRDVLFPPFDTTWIEWREQHYRAGAHITRTASNRLAVQLVISSRKQISFYDQPDLLMLNAAGVFTARDDFADQLWNRRLPHQQDAFNRAYDILAHLNHPRTVREEVGTGRYRIAGEPRADERMVLVDVAPTTPVPTRHSRDESTMPLHNVRGHVRRYRTGTETWVKPHQRGDAANGANISTYRVKPPAGE